MGDPCSHVEAAPSTSFRGENRAVLGDRGHIAESLDSTNGDPFAVGQPVLCGELELPNRPSSIRRARGAARILARRSGCSPVMADNIALAVSEAVTNAIIHGYAGSSGSVQMVVESTADELLVTVADTGGGLSPRTDSPGLGLGLSIIAEVTTHLRVDSPPGGGTRLRMAFRRA